MLHRVTGPPLRVDLNCTLTRMLCLKVCFWSEGGKANGSAVIPRHFLKHCGALSPDKLVLFRDLEEQRLFWSPAKWKSREELEAWRMGSTYKSALAKIEADVSEHFTHIMDDVRGFPSLR